MVAIALDVLEGLADQFLHILLSVVGLPHGADSSQNEPQVFARFPPGQHWRPGFGMGEFASGRLHRLAGMRLHPNADAAVHGRCSGMYSSMAPLTSPVMLSFAALGMKWQPIAAGVSYLQHENVPKADRARSLAGAIFKLSAVGCSPVL